MSRTFVTLALLLLAACEATPDIEYAPDDASVGGDAAKTSAATSSAERADASSAVAAPPQVPPSPPPAPPCAAKGERCASPADCCSGNCELEGHQPKCDD